MAWIRLTAAISIGIMAVTAGPPAAAGTHAAATAETGRPAAPPGGYPVSVRLITGDRVTVTAAPGGRRTASVRPGPGREHIAFRTLEEDGSSLTVLPQDAEALVTAGTLDRRLFDVTVLISQRYDEAHTAALPLIVSSAPVSETARNPGGRSHASAEASAEAEARADRLTALHSGRTPARRLTSIDARAVRIDGDELGAFWRTLTGGAPDSARRAAATPMVSLDARVRAVLDRSTAQINAPALWKTGDEGQGVKVAVLDTGADTGHPDLAGRVSAAEDFSGSGNTGDHFGHGTHVAATVGGSGTASAGTRRGVAPRADLLIGKVLGDDGYGSSSQVIAGMEWAAEEDADVVNMSLGADLQTDGTDPMSQALDTLSATTGTLFVVAAGNAGPAEGTVGSPGAADSALTVGAVDRDDSLASFSSRGPRHGDAAAKPDVTAPGVDIVAARAAGTGMGHPVDASYTAASGTSMATPHVAGAAALLLQRHPEWTGQQVKDALISTSHTVPGTKVTEQGGGRIDLAAAAGPVTATGTVTLDPVERGEVGRRGTATVRYTNTGDRQVELKLAVSLATGSGRSLPDGVVSLDTDTLRVAPGTTAEVPLRVDAGRAERGKYYGYVTATADGRTVAHTTVSLPVRGRQHELKVVVRDRDGSVLPGVHANIWGAEGLVPYTDTEAATATVEEGTYFLHATYQYRSEDGEEVRELFTPEVRVTRDMVVTMSAADVTEVQIRTPRPAEQRGILNVNWYRQLDGYRWYWGSMYFDAVKRVYVTPSAPVTDGDFEFSSRWQLAAPMLRARVLDTFDQFTPYYEPNSPAFPDRGARLAAVDAGRSSTPDFRRARGKLAVLRQDTEPTRADLARAKAAGVEAVLLVWPEGQTVWSRWLPAGERAPLPVLRAPWGHGKALLDRMRGNRTPVVDFSGTVRSPYLYDVMQAAKGSVPRKLVHTVSERESAVVRAAYHRTGDSEWTSEQRFGWRPYQQTSWNNETSRFVPVGRERTEYVTGGDTMWSHIVHHDVVADSSQSLQVGMRNLPRAYRPGERVGEEWFGGVVRPSVPTGVPWSSKREDDVMSLRVAEFTDSAPGHHSFAEVGGFGSGAAGDDTAKAVLYRDGEPIFTSDTGAWNDVEVPSGQAAYRLDLTTARTSPDWRFGTGTRTSWSFTSGTRSEPTPLSLLQLDYDVPVDLRNAVGSGRTHRLGVGVRAQDGAPAPRGVALKAEFSYDDGANWSRAKTVRRGDGTFSITVERPSRVRGDALVSLRMTATDSSGASVRQTVDRAFLHRGAGS
ncbi:S8 family serine peptidase [Streptomyces sp. NPDC086010]|uniref:S8 family serine peptidase n=1 Tax=Streptomyces sp. NPDC086010 TaxID=3365745 RepID=UPI0037D8E557